MSVPILVLDDISAVQNATAWVQETVFVLINARYNELLPTIVTSNLPPKALEERIGDRLVSRLVEMCLVIECKGRDQRLGPHEPPPIVRPSLPKPARDGTMTLDEAIAKGVKF